jgi:hypothetical protein
LLAEDGRLREIVCQQLSGGKHLGAYLPVEPSYWQVADTIAEWTDSLIEPVMVEWLRFAASQAVTGKQLWGSK